MVVIAGCGGCGKNAGCQCAVKVVNTDCLNLTLSGSGTKANPWCISGEPNVSDTADNQLSCEADGLYVPPSMLTVADTPCIDLTLQGNELTAVPVISPVADNALECTAAGLYVSSADTIATLNTPTVTMALAGGNLSANVNVDCGLVIGTDGVGVNVAGDWATDFPDCPEDQGDDLYCDADGVLHGPAPRLYEQGFGFGDDGGAPDVIIPAGATQSLGVVPFDVTNPSTCYDFSYLIKFDGRAVIELDPGGQVDVDLVIGGVVRDTATFADVSVATFNLTDGLTQDAAPGATDGYTMELVVRPLIGAAEVRNWRVTAYWNGHST